MEKNYAIVDTTQTPQVVITSIVWDQEAYPDYDIHKGLGISDGLIAVQSDTAAKGFIYDPVAQTFTNPNQNDGTPAAPPADPVPSA